MPDLTSQSIGRYQILEKIGEGGMAVVYKAYDTHLETDVALKVIRTESLPQKLVPQALARFEREAKSLARLTHPNIIGVIDYGKYKGSPYLVMKYLPGGNLSRRLGSSTKTDV
jgi:serine/threonine protein kinase